MHTVAVGDQRNDLEMLRWAARGVAMGNAPDEVKAAADEVAGDVDDDGLVASCALLCNRVCADLRHGIPRRWEGDRMNTLRGHLRRARGRQQPRRRVGCPLGYVVVGILHLVIAWIALKVAWGIGGGSKDADASGP